MFGSPRLGLVLGGGAHVGVMRVLEEIGYRPDVVVGASIGGIIAGLTGLGWSAGDLQRFSEEFDFDRLIHLDRSGAGLLSPEPLRSELQRIFGERDLRDLSPRVAVMGADIRTGQRVLLDQGPVVTALMATSAVPGLFPAVEWGDRLLVDGGIVSSVPTQAAYQLGANRVVAVNLGGGVSMALGLDELSRFSNQASRAFYWLLSLSRRQQAFDTLVAATSLSYHTLVQYELILYPPDVLLQPDVGAVGLLALDHIPETVEAGTSAAREATPRIRRLMRSTFRNRSRPSRGMAPLVVAAAPDMSHGEA
jgi:NTE family protein